MAMLWPKKSKDLYLQFKSKPYQLMLISTKLHAQLDETVNHLISCCPFLECKSWHNCVVSHVHRMLAKQDGFSVQDLWWKHFPPQLTVVIVTNTLL